MKQEGLRRKRRKKKKVGFQETEKLVPFFPETETKTKTKNKIERRKSSDQKGKLIMTLISLISHFN